MPKPFVRLCLTLATLALASTAHARTIYYGNEAESVPVIAGGPPHLFRFSQEVRTISHAQNFEIKPANADTPNYALLSVRPRLSSGSSDVSFILSDGSIVKVRIVVVSKDIPERTDSIYDFKPKDSLVQGEESPGPHESAPMPEIDLMKAIIRDDEVTGYEIRRVSRSISPGIRGVSIQLIKIYSGNPFNGYIFEVANNSPRQKLFIDIRNLALGDPDTALISSVDQDVIEPKGHPRSTTYLRVVAKSTSISSELKLPIQVVENKGKE